MEWHYALEEEKRIIPCMVDGTELSPLLRTTQYFDFREIGAGMSQLFEALELTPADPTPSIKPKLQAEIEVARKAEADEKRKELESKRKAEHKSSQGDTEAKRKAKAEKKRQEKITPSKKSQKKRTTTAASLAKVSPGPASPKIKLRSTPNAYLSEADVKKMLAERGFYDSELNKNGRGFANQFKPVESHRKSLIIDEKSGLTWQQSGTSWYKAYEKAQADINELNNTHYAGYSDWRLPTLEEAMSLMEPKPKKGFLYIDPIFDKSQTQIWTADKVSAPFYSRAWVANFSYGYCNHIDVHNGIYVRAVR